MRTQLLMVLTLVLSFAIQGIAGEITSEELPTKPSPKVQQMIAEFQLQTVDFDYVKQAIGSGTRKGAKALLIDARPNAKYLKGTIPSSINIPDTQFDTFFSQIATADKTREIIVFCGGWKCGKSPKVANLLKQKGFVDVKVYPAGEPDWGQHAYLEIGTPVIQAAQQNNSAVIIDARPHKKYLQATIPGAISIPDSDMEALAGRLPASKKEKIIAFCGGYDCGKSHKLAKHVQSLGYQDVTVYAGGLPQWQSEGLATTAGGATTSTVANAPAKGPAANGMMPGFDDGTVDGEWFKDLLVKHALPENVLLVSVVPPEDYSKGTLEGAINIYAEPLKPEELRAKLPKDKVIVFCCASGSRALEAWYKLSDAKLDTANIYYFDAIINCEEGSDCQIKPHPPLG